MRSCCLLRQSYIASSSSEEMEIKQLSFSDILRVKIHFLRNLQFLVRRVLGGFRLSFCRQSVFAVDFNSAF